MFFYVFSISKKERGKQWQRKQDSWLKLNSNLFLWKSIRRVLIELVTNCSLNLTNVTCVWLALLKKSVFCKHMNLPYNTERHTLTHTKTSTLLKIDCLFQYFDMKFAYISKNGIYIHVLATWHRCPVII